MAAMVTSISLVYPLAAEIAYNAQPWYTYYRYTQTVVKESAFNNDAMLTIDAYTGNILVIADQTDKIIVEATKRAVTKKALANLEPFIRLREKEAQVVTTFKEDSWFNGSITGCIDYVIRVPKSIHLPRIMAGSGSIGVDGVQGVIAITAGTGSVTLKNVVGGITVSTTAGSISIDCAHNAQGIIDAHSSAGLITINGTRNSVRASTVAGSIVVKQKELPETTSITLESSLGAISLTLPQASNARLQAQTNMGSFYSAFPLMQKGNNQQGWLHKNVDATIGDGGSALIKMATTSGAISIYKN